MKIEENGPDEEFKGLSKFQKVVSQLDVKKDFVTPNNFNEDAHSSSSHSLSRSGTMTKIDMKEISISNFEG